MQRKESVFSQKNTYRNYYLFFSNVVIELVN
nr:MAG TPA: hypothetical protein [Caudoviricetes sp.]